MTLFATRAFVGTLNPHKAPITDHTPRSGREGPAQTERSKALLSLAWVRVLAQTLLLGGHGHTPVASSIPILLTLGPSCRPPLEILT